MEYRFKTHKWLTNDITIILPQIVIVCNNHPIYHSRLSKCVRSLGKKYSVVVLAWNRADEISSKNNRNNDSMNLKLFGLKAPYGKQKRTSYMYMMIYFSFFWTWVLVNLIKHRPRVVHACDLDTVFPCYVYKKIFRKKLVFEILDRYAMNAIPTKFRLIYSFVHRLEDSFAQKADLLITVGDKFLDSIKCKPKKSLVILNCPEDYHINKKIKVQDVIFKVVYTDRVITRIRGVRDMVSAIGSLNNARLVIAGRFIDKELHAETVENPNLEYVGILKPADALELEAASDAMIALADPEIPQTDIAMPTKFFESMMSGVPIITNIRSDFVNEIGFGIIVEYGNIEQIRSAIVTLRDNPKLRKRLGDNGRKAFVEKYNWGIMEQKLYKAYEELY
jgi:glycosyltransferase involved in cell wall biosynthesis